MTVLLFAAGGVLAGLGTRSAAVFFVASAVFGAMQSDPLLAAVCTWTACVAAAWILLERSSPRDATIPCLGAAAILAAAGAPNGAVVLGLWVLGTVTVVLQRGHLVAGRRWAIALAIGDVVFGVAIATTAGRGFEAWPSTLKQSGAIVMLAAAVVRAPLAGGYANDSASASFAASLVVRAQTVVLVGLAASSADRTLLRVIVLLGVAAFAASTASPRRAVVDAVQELGLVAVAISAAELGWVHSGWTWGVLAGGTVLHLLRLLVGSSSSGAVADVLGRGAGIGLPFLPACAALLDGAFRTTSRLGVVVGLVILAGLAGRTRLPESRTDVPDASLDHVRAWAPIAGAAAVSVAAPLVWGPSPPAGGEVSWPPLWGAGIVAVAAAAGSQLRGVVSRPRDDDLEVERFAFMRSIGDRLAPLDAIATDVVLWAAVTAVAAAAVVLWLVGLGRGFL